MKTRYPRDKALAVAVEICGALKTVTERLKIAGSLRRMKPDVGDVEIIYVPKFGEGPPRDLFGPPPRLNLADVALDYMLGGGVIQKRRNVRGSEIWGAQNKLAVHAASGIPVDFFAATESNWFNYLVCRTGGAINNTIIAGEAKRKGWQWNPYGPGFTDGRGQVVPVTSEQDVFRFVGLPYLEPKARL
jgi:DNA polymerase/3'-5' exonuclease PolX